MAQLLLSHAVLASMQQKSLLA